MRFLADDDLRDNMQSLLVGHDLCCDGRCSTERLVRSVLSRGFGEPFRCDRPREGSNMDQAVGADVDDLGDRDGVPGSDDPPASDDDR